MVDDFLAAGGSYFDTAYTYLGGASETALRETAGMMVGIMKKIGRFTKRQLQILLVTDYDVK